MRGYTQQNTEETILQETQSQNGIESQRSQIKWMDINQFLEGRKYVKTGIFSLIRTLFLGGFLICLGIIIAGVYYSCTNHMMYSSTDSFQAEYVNVFEKILIELDVINPANADDYPIMAPYVQQEGITFSVIWGTVFIIAFFVLEFVDSSKIIKNIYNIQDGDKRLRFRIVENTKGKKGICKAGRLKIRKVLPFQYDEIFATYENSYVCKRDGKFGVYNADLKKMAIPVMYEDIYSISPESIILIKDGQKHCLSHKGYRIVK